MLTCPILSHPSISHGFFTRAGGHSYGLYSSLNCGYGSGDNLDIVSHNRAVVAEKLGAKPDALLTAFQIHSAKAVVVDSPWNWREAPEADALVTKNPCVAIGVLTADCTPVLFADCAHGIIGAAHAGWKGAFSGIVEATVEAMCRLGASPDSITATIGPAIAQASYEVSHEFYERFIRQSENHARFFSPSLRNGHYQFNLTGYVQERLAACGIRQIGLLPHDTFREADQFFSYRRATLRGEGVYGRQISAIMIKE